MKAFLRLRPMWIVYGALLAGILIQAAFLRFRLPQTPLIDKDVWGYLRPAFSKLQGGPFEHTQGRNFLYPAFLWAVLKLFGDYRFISGSQHVLGLLTGVVVAAAWNMLCGLLTAGGAAFRWGARFLGLGLVADFLWSRSPLLFEHTIRPEAVFPLFLALSFLLNLIALKRFSSSVILSGAQRSRRTSPEVHAPPLFHARPKAEGTRVSDLRGPSTALRMTEGDTGEAPLPNTQPENAFTLPRVAWCLGLNFLVTAALLALKPSFGFGVGAANLPLLYWLARRDVPWRPKLATAGTAVAAAGLLLWLPEHVLKQGDAASETFLPTTLFTIHAVPIHEQIVDDLRDGHTAPYDPAWLRDFNAELEPTLNASKQPENYPWHLLGFNADYLMYKHSVFKDFFPREQPAKVAAFGFHYYQRAWLHRPGEMLAKIGRQLASVYPLHAETTLGYELQIDFRRKHWARQFFTRQLPAVYNRRAKWPLAHEYQSAWTTCQIPRTNRTLASSPASQEYLQQVEALRTTDAQFTEPAWVCYINNLTTNSRLWALIVAVLAGAVLARRQRSKEAPLLMGVGLVFAVNFAMFLTVAVVHSLDGERYIETQRLLTLWSAFAAVLLIAETLAALTPRRPALPPLP